MISRGPNIPGRAQAHPAQLVVQLYESAIDLIELAIRGHQDGSSDVMHASLNRAEAIVTELRAPFNRNHGAAGDDLDRMYEMLYRKLVLANARKDPNVAQEVLGYLRELLTTWQYVAQETPSSKVSAPITGPPET